MIRKLYSVFPIRSTVWSKLAWSHFQFLLCVGKGGLKETFEGAANIREGYFGLQKKIYR